MCVFVILFVRPVEAPGSLSLCSFHVKSPFICLFICKTCRSARQPVCLCLLNNKICQYKKMVRSLMQIYLCMFILLRPVGHQAGSCLPVEKVNCCYFKGSHWCCYSQIKECLVVLTPLSHSAPGLMLLFFTMSVTWFSGWDCCSLPGSLWGSLFLDFFL